MSGPAKHLSPYVTAGQNLIHSVAKSRKNPKWAERTRGKGVLLVSVQCSPGILDAEEEQEAGVAVIKPSDHKQTPAGRTPRCQPATFFPPFISP